MPQTPSPLTPAQEKRIVELVDERYYLLLALLAFDPRDDHPTLAQMSQRVLAEGIAEEAERVLAADTTLARVLRRARHPRG